MARVRGGLAPRLAVPISNAAAEAPLAETRVARPTRFGLSDLRRVAWTLPYVAFMLYIVAVITSRFSVGTFAVPVALLGVLVQGKPVRTGPLVLTMVGFLSWCALGTVASVAPSDTADALFEYLKLTLIVFAGVNSVRTPTQVRVFMAIVVASFILYPGKGAVYNYLTGSVRQGRAAWSGVYGNPNDLAGIAILILAIAVALLAYRLPHWARLATLGAAGFIGFVMLVTQSRGALIGATVFGIGLLVRATSRQRVRVALGLVVGIGVLSIFAPAGVWERLSGLRNLGGSSAQLREVDAEGSAEQRFEIWKVAGTIAAEHPVFGVGLGSYATEHARVSMRSDFDPIARGPRDAHSTYLNVLAETGLVGFALFLAMLAFTWRTAARVRRRAAGVLPAEETTLRVLQLGLLGFLVAGVWGTYGKLNMIYLFLLLISVVAEATRAELARLDGGAPPGRGPHLTV